ncbi:MAG: hypothetical protein ABI584_11635 [Acidobacteriota bacterium]
MARFTRVTFVFAFVLVAAVANAEEAAGPLLRHWSAPAYWSAVRPTPVGGSAGLSPAGRTALLAFPPAYAFVAISPCRQYDSRSTSALLQATPRTVTLTGAPCNIPAGVAAVSANIAMFNIVGAGGNGVFSVGIPSGTSQAWLNYAPTVGQIDNAGALAVDGSGNIAVTVNQGAGSVDFVVDVNGYYTLNGITAQFATSAGSAGNFTGPLAGDVTGTQGATVVSTVGASTAANVHSAELAANAATSSNVADTIVKRDGAGSINAQVVSAAGGYTQPGTGGETLRIVRGMIVASTGNIVLGSGFSAVRNSVGVYTITFTQAFSGPPVITLTNLGTGIAGVSVLGSGSFVVYTLNLAGAAADVNGYVMFTAIGPP